MNRLLQPGFTCAKRDDYTTIGICNQQRTFSKNLYYHFVPSQRSCKAILLNSALKRAQPGAGPGPSSDQMASAQQDCPNESLHEELVCSVRALSCTLQSLQSQRHSQRQKCKQLVLCCHPTNMVRSSAVPVLHKITKQSTNRWSSKLQSQLKKSVRCGKRWIW